MDMFAADWPALAGQVPWSLLAQADAAASADGSIVWKKLGLFVGVLAVAFGLGWALARGLRQQQRQGQIGLCLFLVLFAFSPFINDKLLYDRPVWETITLGIDLAGGTNLVYQLEHPPSNPETMSRVVGAIRKRIDPAATKELTIRQVGSDRVELIIPRATPEVVREYKLKMTTVGNLEFHIVANKKKHADIIKQANQLAPTQREVRDSTGQVIAAWTPIQPEVVVEGGERVERPQSLGKNEQTVDSYRPAPGKPGFEEVLLVYERNKKKRVTGYDLKYSTANINSKGQAAVFFTFSIEGSSKFAALTSENLPDVVDNYRSQLAIVLDGYVASAPEIRETISGSGEISGNFTMEEAKSLADILNAGALDVPLKKNPISEFTISPTLGIDVRQKGVTALVLATIAIAIFMLYYRYLGLVADFCLLLNLVLLIGCVAIIDATLTLPGMAGIVLTMGMAVDANVLIYERIREELAKGSSLRMAIQNGFGRAFSSIFDSNITTLITAAILYVIGTDQIRGFAVTLFFGLAISMYTALTVNRMILEICERKRWLKNFKMFSLFQQTSIDFVGKQAIAAVLSIVFIVSGVAAFVMRGQAAYDIDFTGGTMVTMEFVGERIPSDDEIRGRLRRAFQQSSADVTLEKLTASIGDHSATMYRVRTTLLDDALVRKQLNETFGNELRRVTMSYGPIGTVAAPAQPAEGSAEPAADADPFAGGHEVAVEFSGELRPSNFLVYLLDETVKLTDESGSARFGTPDETQALFRVAEAAEAGDTARFKKMMLQVQKVLPKEDLEKLLASTQATMADTPVFDEVNRFESQVASDMKWTAVNAMLLSLITIVIYIWFRFENLYFGFAAVLALAHDVLATIGFVAFASLLSETPLGPWLLFTDFKMNLTMVAALLTIVGYSLNDTIVIFDRLREIRGKNPHITRDMVNLAVNQTLSRTLLTAGTVFVAVFILYVAGGEGIHGFAYAMLIGTIVGCYSTVYVASPFVLFLAQRQAAKGKVGAAASTRPAAAAR